MHHLVKSAQKSEEIGSCLYHSTGVAVSVVSWLRSLQRSIEFASIKVNCFQLRHGRMCVDVFTLILNINGNTVINKFSFDKNSFWDFLERLSEKRTMTQLFRTSLLLSLLISVLLNVEVSSTHADESVWLYQQSTGRLSLDGKEIGSGYSGKGAGLNNPKLEDKKDVGPIPRGLWSIGEAFTHEKYKTLTMRLTPVDHDARGRDSFLIHGDNKKMNNTASKGCIILSRELRQKISSSKIKKLKVIEWDSKEAWVSVIGNFLSLIIWIPRRIVTSFKRSKTRTPPKAFYVWWQSSRRRRAVRKGCYVSVTS